MECALLRQSEQSMPDRTANTLVITEDHWYNFVSDQYSGFHGIVIPGTLRDSIFVLEGLLEQETGLNPTEIMTDTAGASELVFGLFWLLGYQFSPRRLMPVLRFSGEWTMMPTMAC